MPLWLNTLKRTQNQVDIVVFRVFRADEIFDHSLWSIQFWSAFKFESTLDFIPLNPSKALFGRFSQNYINIKTIFFHSHSVGIIPPRIFLGHFYESFLWVIFLSHFWVIFESFTNSFFTCSKSHSEPRRRSCLPGEHSHLCMQLPYGKLVFIAINF